MAKEENPSVTRFREYLRFPTVHPHPDYKASIDWLKNQANEIGLEFHIVHFPKPAEFTLWMTWVGSNPDLPSVLLNSHIDVVPVDAKSWTHDPFGAEKDAEGNIYARGSQDMKCVGIQYLEAIRNLKKEGFQPLRNVHVTFVPDEEVGGAKGMGAFVKSPEFAKLNVGFALDEGYASTDDVFHVFYAERNIWQFCVTAKGKAGHASIMFDGTAAEKLQHVINRLLELRNEQKLLLDSNPDADIGSVTSINLTMLKGGLQANVVPPELSAVFDMRVTPSWDLDLTEQKIRNICIEAGSDVELEFIQQFKINAVTSLGPENHWWTAFQSAAQKMNLQFKTKIIPGATDIRYLRHIGIPALGFSPMNNTPILLHDHDEFLNENIFLRGISIYEQILKDITHVPN